MNLPPPRETLEVLPEQRGNDPQLKLWGTNDDSCNILRGLGFLNGVPIHRIGGLIAHCHRLGFALLIRTDPLTASKAS